MTANCRHGPSCVVTPTCDEYCMLITPPDQLVELMNPCNPWPPKRDPWWRRWFKR